MCVSMYIPTFPQNDTLQTQIQGDKWQAAEHGGTFVAVYVLLPLFLLLMECV